METWITHMGVAAARDMLAEMEADHAVIIALGNQAVARSVGPANPHREALSYLAAHLQDAECDFSSQIVTVEGLILEAERAEQRERAKP